MTEEPYPFKPGDWVGSTGDHQRVAKVKAVSRSEGEVLLDLVIYDRRGKRIGRESPACGGPRTFEPCCHSDGWERIAEPRFPVTLKWVSDGGKTVARFWAAETLPPANYTPRPRRRPVAIRASDDRLRRALEQIASGHNDPRALAALVLGHTR